MRPDVGLPFNADRRILLEAIREPIREARSSNEMKEALEQAGGFFPSDAQAAEVLQPTDGAFDGPAAFMPTEGAAVLSGCSFSVRTMGSDQLDSRFGKQSVERIAVVGFVSDHALGQIRADQEIEQALDGVTFVRAGLHRVRGDG